VSVVVVLAALVTAAGCVQEMADQPRVEPLEELRRPDEVAPPRGPVAGTVARGQVHDDEVFATGKAAGDFTSELPQKLSERLAAGELLPRGRERFGIFCSHCHGLAGGGDGGDAAMRSHVGMVVKAGFPTPPTFHQPRLRETPIGRIFDVVTYGVGRMPAHGYLIPPEDRWAIAAYVKALQLSQFAERNALSPGDITKLDATTQP
jgi:mono/diheme cytochrome c family protein